MRRSREERSLRFFVLSCFAPAALLVKHARPVRTRKLSSRGNRHFRGKSRAREKADSEISQRMLPSFAVCIVVCAQIPRNALHSSFEIPLIFFRCNSGASVLLLFSPCSTSAPTTLTPRTAVQLFPRPRPPPDPCAEYLMNIRRTPTKHPPSVR